MQLPTQEQFVDDCLAKYRWEPIPSDQKWEEAHFPIPDCLGGEDTVMLWSADHTVQGLLQSVELDQLCFYYKANKKDLYNLETHYPEYLPLFQQLKSQFSRRLGKKTFELGVGVHAPGVRSAGGKKAAVTNQANSTSIFAPGMQSAGGKKSVELKLGCHAPGRQSAGGKKGGKIVGNQRWQCLVTGHITTPGPLSRYQKARGIDTKLRVKLNYTGF